ncbi:hypothetical protein [Dokdonella sp.]|uniref:hypothetical protein n=1 Tax=Dokdonella sp. TaxID=2291710 RepID=UPI002DD64ECE|nr:hypothetical protein [Dokdonella sp.]
MNAHTALEIALDLDAASCSSFAKLEAAEALRQQHAEIERLREMLTDDHEALWEECLVLRKYVGNNMLMSDFRNVDEMRAEIERLTAERDEAIAADQEIERLRSQVARLRAVIVGLVGEDDLHGLAVMAEFLERLDHDDARKSLDVVMALLEIRPEGERSRK